MTVFQGGPIPLSNFMPGRNDPVDGTPIKLDSIVLHTMVGWIASADARFHNGLAQVSAHFGVRVDGSLWQWVQTWDTAYHAGLFYENLRSVGIEHEDAGDYNGVRPDELYARSASLVAQLCRENGIPCVRGTGGPGIYDHRDIIKVMGDGTATACPDALDTNRIIREAAALLSTVPTPTPAVDVTVLRPETLPPLTIVQQWAAIYKAEAPKAGIRADVALAQALHETSRFTFTGTAQAAWNNPAGLGVTGMAGVGNQFPTKYDGVVAHLQHLLLYFTPDHTAYCTPPTVDQRHWTHKGYPNDVHQFDGHWAVPGVGYGDAILALVPEAHVLLAAIDVTNPIEVTDAPNVSPPPAAGLNPIDATNALNSPPQPTSVSTTSPTITIVGPDAFVTQTNAALALITQKAPGFYAEVIGEIKSIVSVSSGSGITVGSSGKNIYSVGQETAFHQGYTAGDQIIWYASTIVHDAHHSWLYHQGQPYAGRDGELACLIRQRDALAVMETDTRLSHYVQSLIDGVDNPAHQYWTNPNRHW